MQGGGDPFPGGVILPGQGGAGGFADQLGGQGEPGRGAPDPPDITQDGGRGDLVAGGDRGQRVGRSPGQAVVVQHHPHPVPGQRPDHLVHKQGHHRGRGRLWRRGLLVGHHANATQPDRLDPVVPASSGAPRR